MNLFRATINLVFNKETKKVLANSPEDESQQKKKRERKTYMTIKSMEKKEREKNLHDNKVNGKRREKEKFK